MKKSLFLFSLVFLLIVGGVGAQEQQVQQEEVELEVSEPNAKEKKQKAPKEKKKKSQETESETADEISEATALQEESVAQEQQVQQEEAVEDSLVESTNETETPKKNRKSRGESQDNPEHWPTIRELYAAQFNFGVVHNWGAAWATVTRIQKQDGISNFVWKDRLVGAFYEISTENFKKYNDFWSMNFVARMAVYYPYRYRFRDVPQNTVQTLLYNFDWFLAPKLTYSLFDRVRFDLGVGLHMSYQLHDKFHFFNMGVGAKFDTELPISSRWTLLLGGMFSWDNGNLGTNGTRGGNSRPFDFVYEYQVQIGARYSKKHLNPFSYIRYKPKPLKTKKVRKLKTYSDQLDLELDLPPEVLEEYIPKEESPLVEEDVAVEAEFSAEEPTEKETKKKSRSDKKLGKKKAKAEQLESEPEVPAN